MDEPPPPRRPVDVTQRTLWRLAMCVLRDHTPTDGPDTACERCLEPWPCQCRRLAVRALTSATPPARRRRTGNQAYLDWLAARMREEPHNEPHQ